MCLSLAAPPGAGRVAPACGRLPASAMILFLPPPLSFHLSSSGRLEDQGQAFRTANVVCVGIVDGDDRAGRRAETLKTSQSRKSCLGAGGQAGPDQREILWPPAKKRAVGHLLCPSLIREVMVVENPKP